MRDIAVGSFTSDGNAKNVSCGFVPDVVILVNEDTPSFGFYFCGETQAKDPADLSKTFLTGVGGVGVNQAAAVTGDYGDGVLGFIGSENAAPGFTVKAVADCPENVNASAVKYVALRSDRNLPVAV